MIKPAISRPFLTKAWLRSERVGPGPGTWPIGTVSKGQRQRAWQIQEHLQRAWRSFCGIFRWVFLFFFFEILVSGIFVVFFQDLGTGFSVSGFFGIVGGFEWFGILSIYFFPKVLVDFVFFFSFFCFFVICILVDFA